MIEALGVIPRCTRLTHIGSMVLSVPCDERLRIMEEEEVAAYLLGGIEAYYTIRRAKGHTW